MQAPAVLSENALVGGFLDQRVLEDVLQLRKAALFADDLELLEVGEPGI